MAYLWRRVSGSPNTLVASPYWATMRSVFRSPPPPIMIGTRGRLMACGEFRSRVAVKCFPSWRSWLPLPPDHISCAIWSVSSSISNRSPSGGNRQPRAMDSASFHAAPMPNQARPPDRTSRVVVALIHTPGGR